MAAAQISFSVLFFILLLVPLMAANFSQETQVAEGENRYLTGMPSLFTEDGHLKSSFPAEFESWYNDNVGFRNQFIAANGMIQYGLFHRLPSGDVWLGPKGEWNYLTDRIQVSAQHKDLRTEDEVEEIADAYETIGETLLADGRQFYYMQCWDKQSIYPEMLPSSLIQYGEDSAADQIAEALEKRNLHFINPKQALIDAKGRYSTYSSNGDPTHWTHRGAYIAYRMLMEAINEENEYRYPVLEEKDYNLGTYDSGPTYSQSVHVPNYDEGFVILNPRAKRTDEKLTETAWTEDARFYTNESVDNDTTVLLLADSYVRSFIADDLAESFHQVIVIHPKMMSLTDRLIADYDPQIIVLENAERTDRSQNVVDLANSMNPGTAAD